MNKLDINTSSFREQDVKIREAEVKTRASVCPSTLPPELFTDILCNLGGSVAAAVNRKWYKYSKQASQKIPKIELEKIQRTVAFLYDQLKQVLSVEQKEQLEKISHYTISDSTKISSTRKELSVFKKSIATILKSLPDEDVAKLRRYNNPSRPMPNLLKNMLSLVELYKQASLVPVLQNDLPRYYVNEQEDNYTGNDAGSIVRRERRKKLTKKLEEIPVGFFKLGDADAAMQFVRNHFFTRNFFERYYHHDFEIMRGKALVSISNTAAQEGFFNLAVQISKAYTEYCDHEYGRAGINYYQTRILLHTVYALVDKALSDDNHGFLERAFAIALTIREKGPMRISDISKISKEIRDEFAVAYFCKSHWHYFTGFFTPMARDRLCYRSAGPEDKLHQSNALRKIANAYMELARLHPTKQVVFLNRAFEIASKMKHGRESVLKVIWETLGKLGKNRIANQLTNRVNEAIKKEEKEKKDIQERGANIDSI